MLGNTKSLKFPLETFQVHSRIRSFWDAAFPQWDLTEVVYNPEFLLSRLEISVNTDVWAGRCCCQFQKKSPYRLHCTISGTLWHH